MSTTQTRRSQAEIDAAYSAQRARLVATVSAAVSLAWGQLYADRSATIAAIVKLVETGQATLANLVGVYFAAKQLQTTGTASQVSLNSNAYTTLALRGIPAEIVYGRPFGAYGASVDKGATVADAIASAQAYVKKIAATDLQLAQTHAARDWMRATSAGEQGELRIVGYRRVITNPNACKLCVAASTRTYRIADLMPIHEHCDCGVQPLWGTDPVASVGTTVRVEEDPEIGPRLMADTWSDVGPRLTE